MDSLTRRLSALDRQRAAMELRKAGATYEVITHSGRQNVSAAQIATSMDELTARYRAGRIDAEQAHQELALLLGQLKAAELSVLAEKLDRIEAALEGRKVPR